MVGAIYSLLLLSHNGSLVRRVWFGEIAGHNKV